jgi:hypothetical protein
MLGKVSSSSSSSSSPWPVEDVLHQSHHVPQATSTCRRCCNCCCHCLVLVLLVLLLHSHVLVAWLSHCHMLLLLLLAMNMSTMSQVKEIITLAGGHWGLSCSD